MNGVRAVFAGLLAGIVMVGAVRADEPPVRVVYHVDGGLEQASRALRNIRNNLEAEPKAQIVVVAIGAGVDFLLKDTKDAGGYPYELTVEQLADQGVRFEVCGNTLASRHLKESDISPEAHVIRFGMAEIARLQFREHYAYIKP